ncbi:hypothetical protein DLM_3797 [Aquitalea magnusonii]|uniref:Uncharacterized protein n=1 Tax=Aquitalea magnusonii TaxID=332411 RepID=A0A3G9GNC1_9NEIS|nr:hypothetical protein DLM_3797 [Aquitalea magnusonii]
MHGDLCLEWLENKRADCPSPRLAGQLGQSVANSIGPL